MAIAVVGPVEWDIYMYVHGGFSDGLRVWGFRLRQASWVACIPMVQGMRWRL